MKFTPPIKNYINSLNGLRAICIFMVVGCHFKISHFFNNNFLLKYIGLIAFNGQLAVSLFFIISGFLITTLLINEKKESGRISLKNFYIRRILRIFPAYYFFLFICFILQVNNYFHINSTGWLSSLTFTKQFYNIGLSELDPLWSLSVEEFFYLLWPLIYTKAEKRASMIAVCGIFITAFARLLLYDFPDPKLSNTLFTTSDALFIGCLTAINYEKIIITLNQNKKLILYSIFLLLLSQIIYHGLFSYIYKSVSPSLPLLFLGSITFSFLGNVGILTNISLIVILVHSINVKDYWFVILNSKIANHFGKLSYSIYLYHSFFTADREYLHEISLGLLIASIYLSALISYKFIEKPFLRLKDRFVRHKPQVIYKSSSTWS